jgi:NADPH:quinone reductase-like Zn-dependent oxidoreductase
VTGPEAGRRVAWYLKYGSCAELVVLPASALIPVPDEIAAAEAAHRAIEGRGTTGKVLLRVRQA